MRNSATAFAIVNLFFAAILTAQSAEPAAGAISFTDISKQAGVQINPRVGGHGVVFGDVNNDGFVDFYVTNTLSDPANVPNYLFINNGDGTFSQESGRRGVQDAEKGRNEILGSHGAVFADLDRDGYFDLFLGNAGYYEPGLSRVFINKGTGYFRDMTQEVGLFDKRFGTRGVAVADFNGDGILDLVQTNTYPEEWAQKQPPEAFKTERVFWGRKDGTYEGDDSTGVLEYGFSQGIISPDIDGDGDPDLIESGWPVYQYDDRCNFLWLNNGDGTFVDASEKVGASFTRDPELIERYHGAVAADMDNDGDLDIIVIGDHLRYYRNDGGLNFTELTDSCGIIIVRESYAIIAGDVDNDGDLDIFIPDQSEEFLLFENLGHNTFREWKKTGIKSKRFNDVWPDPRGTAFADIDNDGDLDLVVANKYGYLQVFRNNLKSKNFLRFSLIGAFGDRGAIGTKIYVYPKGKLNKKSSLLAFREAAGSTGYLAQNDPVVHLGLPNGNKRVDILIRFPGGEKVKLRNIRRGKTLLIDASQIKKVVRTAPVVSVLSDAEAQERN